MPPLPPNGTERVLIKYTSDGQPHVMQLRFRDATDPGDRLAFVENVCANMKPIMWENDSITGALFIPYLSNISVPYPITGTGPGTSVIATHNDFTKTAFMSATGKDPQGHDVRVTFFSPGAYGFTDSRVSIGVLAANWANLWDAWVDTTNDQLCTIAGYLPNWNSYVNFGHNSHFQRKSR